MDSVARFDLEQTLAIEFNQDVDLVDLLMTSTQTTPAKIPSF